MMSDTVEGLEAALNSVVRPFRSMNAFPLTIGTAMLAVSAVLSSVMTMAVLGDTVQCFKILNRLDQFMLRRKQS